MLLLLFGSLMILISAILPHPCFTKNDQISFSLALRGKEWTRTVRSSRLAYSSYLSAITTIITCFFELFSHNLDLLLLLIDNYTFLKLPFHLLCLTAICLPHPLNLFPLAIIWIFLKLWLRTVCLLRPILSLPLLSALR